MYDNEEINFLILPAMGGSMWLQCKNLGEQKLWWCSKQDIKIFKMQPRSNIVCDILFAMDNVICYIKPRAVESLNPQLQ